MNHTGSALVTLSFCIKEQCMKKILLLVLSSVLVANLRASDGCNNNALSARILHNVFFDSKLAAAIASLNKMMVEIKDKNIEFLRSKVTSDYWVGRTHHVTTTYYYGGDGNVINVVNRYQKALDHLRNTNALLAAGEGAMLGLLASIIGKTFKLNDKTAGIGIVLCSVLLTLAKNEHVGKVPYLTMRTLVPNDNYFDILTSVGTFLCIAGAGAASYFGTNFLVDAISGKISAVSRALESSN